MIQNSNYKIDQQLNYQWVDDHRISSGQNFTLHGLTPSKIINKNEEKLHTPQKAIANQYQWRSQDFSGWENHMAGTKCTANIK